MKVKELIQAGFVNPKLLNKKARKKVEEIFADLQVKGVVKKVGHLYVPNPTHPFTKDIPVDVQLTKIYLGKH